MKKAELIESVVNKTGLTKADANRAVDALLDTIKDALVAGDKVPFVGFGTFSISERSAREGRNPRTGETVHIPASKLPKFKAGKSLLDQLN